MKAIICHHTDRRLRIKVPAQRENARYFATLRSGFRQKGFEKVKVNPFTGSLIIESESIDLDEIAEFASQNNLFELDKKKETAEPIFKKFSIPVSQLNASFQKASGGDFDLPGIIFTALLGFGVVELMRGNFRMPPWYTAFWYAFGVYTKSLLDRK
jgi:hypothetical protein